jgi:radical SAM superfamily enzyme YgiQ (UPF0313 family)/predicted SAM-dependent methyltransferase
MKSSAGIIFIIPPSRWTDQRYSLGVMYVSSYLRENGYNNQIIDDQITRGGFYTQQDALKLVVRTIEKEKPQFVGLSCLVSEIKEAIDLNREIKRVSPEIRTLVGGTQAFDTPELFLKNGFDYVVRGEGEIATLELIENLSQGKGIEEVKGIVWMKNGNIVHNEPRPMIENIDSLPYPSYDLVNMKRHTAIHSWVIRGLPLKTALVLTARGCPYSCSFCECNAIFGRKVRYRTRENIYGEVKLLRDKYNAEAIWFVDDTLTINKNHIKMVCEIMKDLNMWWGCQGRVNTVNSEMIEEMKESGCLQIDFGVESGSNRVLKEIINKNITIEQTRRAFEICHKYKMRTLANIMIGLPTESKDEMYKTLQLAKEINADSYVLSIATPLPNTKLWEMVDPDIAEDEIYKLNFFESELLDVLNKSEVKDLISLRKEFLCQLSSQHKNRKHLSLFMWHLRILFRTKYKREYLGYYARDYIREIINILDYRLKTDLRGKAENLKTIWYRSNLLNSIRRNINPFLTKVRYKIGNGKMPLLKLHLGCGERRIEGFVNIDWRKTAATDLVCNIKKLPYPDGSVEAIETFHVIEHLSRHDLPKALKEWLRVLQPEGKLIVECPDFDELVKMYMEGNEKALDGIFALQRFEGDYHLFGYNFERLRKVLDESGFTHIEKKTAQDYHAAEWPCIRVECKKVKR